MKCLPSAQCLTDILVDQLEPVSDLLNSLYFLFVGEPADLHPLLSDCVYQLANQLYQAVDTLALACAELAAYGVSLYA